MFEMPCNITLRELVCGPWPYVNSSNGMDSQGESHSELAIILETPLNNAGRLIYRLQQTVTFQEVPIISSWTPSTGELLEFMNTQVDIVGQSFYRSSNLQCLWQQINNETVVGIATPNQTIALEPVLFTSATSVACRIPDDLFKHAQRLTAVLHLTRDNGDTIEATTSASLEMVFTLWRYPQLTKLVAINALGEQQDLSLHIGRNAHVLLNLTGVNLLTAANRNSLCHFEAGSGRFIQTPVTVLDDFTIQCPAPKIPITRQLG